MPLYDVAVLGLGAMGSAAFYQLAKQGARVVGVDRYHPPHSLGSTHGESRITRRAIGEGLAYVPLVSRSHEIWRELEAEGGQKMLHEVGCLVISRPDDAVDRPARSGFISRTREAAKRFDIAHEVLSPAEMRARFPQFAIGDDEIAYYEPGGGYVEPERCVAEQLRLGQEAGGTALFNTHVLSIAPDSDHVTLHTAGEPIRARKLIVSAGSGAASLLGAPFDQLLVPTRQTMHWFELEPELRRHWSEGPVFIWPHGEMADDFFYGFPEIGGLGAIKIADENYGTAVDPDAVDRVVDAAFSHGKYQRHIAPRLRGVSARRHKATTCLYTTTPDSAFIIDWHPRHENILVVSPCSGHGFKHSAAIGEAAMQLVLTGRSGIDLSAFSLRRFPVFNPAG